MDTSHASDELTTGEAARIIGVTTQHIRHLDDTGRLVRARVTDSGRRRYRRGDVEALAMERARRKAVAAAEELAATEARIASLVAA